VRENWDLSAYGGTIDPGMKVVYVQFQDAAGNWSSLLITDSIEYQLAGDPAPSGGGGAGDAWLLALLLGSLLARARRS